MLEGARIVVVVPAFEEAPRLRRMLVGIPSYVDDVVVVDDASQDGTRAVAEACANEDARITVISHATNSGVGAAIVTGYRHALDRPGGANDAFIVMAGDGQMDQADLPAVAGPVVCGQAAYVKGNRYRSAHRRSIPLSRRAGGEVLSVMTSIAIGQHITDSQCGYTAISRAACSALDWSAIFPRFGYPNDVLGELAARKLAIVEVEVKPIYADEVSKLRAWHVPMIAGLIARAGIRRARRNLLRSE
ncbi:MAG: glycosyltransferase family 2 protein [Polyangiaceae bacterium]